MTQPLPLNEEEIAQLEELLAKVHNPLPWKLQAPGEIWNRVILGGTATVLVDGSAFKHSEDAALIVAAVNALPKLLAAVRPLDGPAEEKTP